MPRWFIIILVFFHLVVFAVLFVLGTLLDWKFTTRQIDCPTIEMKTEEELPQLDFGRSHEWERDPTAPIGSN